ncbi:hypothetical protein QOT17_007527 [Balamuthia mandrillaris]
MATGRRQRTRVCRLEELAVQRRQEEAQTSERAEREMGEETDDDDDEEEFQRLFQDGRVYRAIMESDSWDIFLPLSERVVLDLSRESKPYVLRHRTRGRTPKLSWLDHILLLLLVYCLACTFDDLAGHFRLKQTTVEAAINRIRPILLEVLEDRWWQGNRRRPIPLMDEDETLSQYAHIALLVDSTSVEVFRPNNSRFEEGKHYFVGKNRIYVLKKEVAVMASPPHFALTWSQHDYSILKEHYSAYIPYLTKSAQETAMIHCVDGNETSWSALFDKGYVGPAQDTPGFRRITIKKQSQVRTAAERFQNRELAKLRVPIECFFGPMYKLWAFLRKPYPYDHNKFDADIDLLILLTNEHLLSAHPLAVDERQYYRAQMRERKENAIERENKRKEAKRRYLENTRKRRYEQYEDF